MESATRPLLKKHLPEHIVLQCNTKLQTERHRSQFPFPGLFQIIEIGLITTITLVSIGCYCFKVCGGKKEDEDENEDNDADISAWKANHISPVEKTGGLINGFLSDTECVHVYVFCCSIIQW